MDLNFIKKNIKAQKYKNIKEFVEDMTLIFTNCKTYNRDDSEIY